MSAPLTKLDIGRRVHAICEDALMMLDDCCIWYSNHALPDVRIVIWLNFNVIIVANSKDYSLDRTKLTISRNGSTTLTMDETRSVLEAAEKILSLKEQSSLKWGI